MISGVIDELRIQVPWTHLQSGQIKITIQNVSIVFRQNNDITPETLRSRKDASHNAKMVS